MLQDPFPVERRRRHQPVIYSNHDRGNRYQCPSDYGIQGHKDITYQDPVDLTLTEGWNILPHNDVMYLFDALERLGELNLGKPHHPGKDFSASSINVARKANERYWPKADKYGGMAIFDFFRKASLT